MRRPYAQLLLPAVAALGFGAGCDHPDDAAAVPAASSPPASAMPIPDSAATPAAAAVPDTLDAREVLPLVARVDAEDADLLRTHPSVFTYDALPFYANAGVLRATALLPTRPVQLRYAYARGAAEASQRTLLPLGTPERVAAANAALGLRLAAGTAPATVLAYLRFYLESAGGEPRSMRRIVERAADVRWLPDSDTDPALRAARERVGARVHPARVEGAGDGGLRVTATTLRGRALEAVTWHVAADGRVREERATVLDADAPVVEIL